MSQILTYVPVKDPKKEKGWIRTIAKCCRKSYPSEKSKDLVCSVCGSNPDTYFIDLAYKGNRKRLYSDRDGDRFKGSIH